MLPKTKYLSFIVFITAFIIGTTSLAENSVSTEVPSCEFSKSTHQDENRKFLIANVRGGLGNRLGAMASAYALAKKTNRCLIIDWPVQARNDVFDEPEMPVSFKELYASKLLEVDNLDEADFISDEEKFEISELKSRSYTAYNWFSKKYGISKGYDFRYLYNYYTPGYFTSMLEGAQEKYLIVSTIHRDFYLSDLDMLGSHEEKVKFSELSLNHLALLQDLIRLHPEMLSAIETFKDEKFPQQNPNAVIIGVHLRTLSGDVRDDVGEILNKGDGGKEGLFKKFVTRMRHAKKLEEENGKKVYFFIASDDLNYVKGFEREFSLDQIIAYPHQEVNRDDLVGMEGALIDFALLGSCDYTVGRFQSTFSDIAALSTREQFKISVGSRWLRGVNTLSAVEQYQRLHASEDPDFAKRLEELSREIDLRDEL